MVCADAVTLAKLDALECTRMKLHEANCFVQTNCGYIDKWSVKCQVEHELLRRPLIRSPRNREREFVMITLLLHVYKNRSYLRLSLSIFVSLPFMFLNIFFLYFIFLAAKYISTGVHFFPQFPRNFSWSAGEFFLWKPMIIYVCFSFRLKDCWYVGESVNLRRWMRKFASRARTKYVRSFWTKRTLVPFYP